MVVVRPLPTLLHVEVVRRAARPHVGRRRATSSRPGANPLPREEHIRPLRPAPHGSYADDPERQRRAVQKARRFPSPNARRPRPPSSMRSAGRARAAWAARDEAPQKDRADVPSPHALERQRPQAPRARPLRLHPPSEASGSPAPGSAHHHAPLVPRPTRNAPTARHEHSPRRFRRGSAVVPVPARRGAPPRNERESTARTVGPPAGVQRTVFRPGLDEGAQGFEDHGPGGGCSTSFWDGGEERRQGFARPNPSAVCRLPSLRLRLRLRPTSGRLRPTSTSDVYVYVYLYRLRLTLERRT